MYMVVVRAMPEFSDQAAHVNWHILCKYSAEMAAKSTWYVYIEN